MAQLIEEKTSNIKHNFVPSQTSRQNDSKEELSTVWFQLYLAVKSLYQFKKRELPEK